ncbi:MAG TPA: TIGR02301 family protein [Pararhizobium sp.]|nr:TIGR02301 family protein [Pararhizobium sp.]
MKLTLKPLHLPIALLACALTLPPAQAQTAGKPPSRPLQAAGPEAPPPAYEDQLLKLAQILGSVDYLRQLCHGDTGGQWRTTMQTLIDTEAAGEPERIRHLTAAFNRGYRSFASVYTTCTESAVTAEQTYRREGATLANQIAAKYGN